jgi:hypothetical protein
MRWRVFQEFGRASTDRLAPADDILWRDMTVDRDAPGLYRIHGAFF